MASSFTYVGEKDKFSIYECIFSISSPHCDIWITRFLGDIDFLE